MKKRYFLIATLAILFALAAFFFIPSRDTHADFGDFSGGSDYGGGSSSSSSSSSYSSGSSSHSSYRSGSSSGSASDGEAILYVLFFGGIIGFFIGRATSSSKTSTPVLVASKPASPSLSPIHAYKSIDPDFDESEFKEKISNLYVQFQNAWQAKNLESLRPYLTDIAFTQYDRQLDRYRKEQKTNKIEKIAVLSVDLEGYSQSNGKDTIVARVSTRITDYVVNDKTGKIVEGSDKVDKFMVYEWYLERSSSVKTINKEGTTEQRCPNCGGALNINHTAKCPYCRRIVTTDKFNWLVSQIKGISQRTGK